MSPLPAPEAGAAFPAPAAGTGPSPLPASAAGLPPLPAPATRLPPLPAPAAGPPPLPAARGPPALPPLPAAAPPPLQAAALPGLLPAPRRPPVQAADGVPPLHRAPQPPPLRPRAPRPLLCGERLQHAGRGHLGVRSGGDRVHSQAWGSEETVGIRTGGLRCPPCPAPKPYPGCPVPPAWWDAMVWGGTRAGSPGGLGTVELPWGCDRELGAEGQGIKGSPVCRLELSPPPGDTAGGWQLSPSLPIKAPEPLHPSGAPCARGDRDGGCFQPPLLLPLKATGAVSTAGACLPK